MVIAIRDTEVSHNNPYSTTERWAMIQEKLLKWGSMVRIIVIPDIDEVCYGRMVGYGIRQIELSEDVQQISGTKTRLTHAPSHQVVWLTGQSGAGKTTLAAALKPLLQDSVILDGDDMRESISVGATLSDEDRHNHNLRVARLAYVLSKQQTVIVSVIAPFERTRAEIDKIINPMWVYCVRSAQKSGPEYPYEHPGNVAVVANGDLHTPAENAMEIIKALGELDTPHLLPLARTQP